MSKKVLLSKLVDNGIIKYGNFTLKSGVVSPVYINIKQLCDNHKLLSLTSVLLYNNFSHILNGKSICGVPYGAIPIATLVSNLNKSPLILLRKEKKSHGLNTIIDGTTENEIVLIEDVITSGKSVLESCELLEQNGYRVKHIICVVFRGDETTLKKLQKYNVNYLFTLDEIVNNKAETGMETGMKPGMKPRMELGMETENERLYNSKQLQLLEYKKQKNSSIILAYDRTCKHDQTHLYETIELLHPHIVGLKVHNEVLGLSFDENQKLYDVCKKYGIFLWEDRKFNDIGNTIENQVNYYSKIRDFISIVPIGGKGSIPSNTNLGVFILCELSSENNVINSLMTQQVLSLINNHNVCGVICQDPSYVPENMLSIMPGIHLHRKNDGKNQIWKTPDNIKHKPTFYVVGRGILNSDNPLQESILYKNKFM